MNDVFKPFPRKYVSVFFDDILVYSRHMEDHIQHLRSILATLRENSLSAKRSKCAFRMTQVEYYLNKIKAV